MYTQYRMEIVIFVYTVCCLIYISIIINAVYLFKRNRKPLFQALHVDSKIGKDTVRSENYNLLPCDLRCINLLEEQLKEIKIDYKYASLVTL